MNVPLTGRKTSFLHTVLLFVSCGSCEKPKKKNALITIPAVQGYSKVLVLSVSPGQRRTEGGGERQEREREIEKDGEQEREREREGGKKDTGGAEAGCKWMNVCGWGKAGWASCEIAPAPATPLCTPLPPRPQPVSCTVGAPPLLPPHKLSAPKPQTPPPVCLFFQVCCTRGGKDRIYHLSAFGSPELRDAGQHKIIIHRHEITKPPGDPTTKLFYFFPPKNRMEGVWLWGEEVTGEKWGWQTGGGGGRGGGGIQWRDVGSDREEKSKRTFSGNCPSHSLCEKTKRVQLVQTMSVRSPSAAPGHSALILLYWVLP